jgi:FG-GAP repeat protein
MATLLLLAVPISAQTVGGGFQSLQQWDGAAANDYFGWSVSAAGDVNADGYADVIVGAYQADAGLLVNAGSAYVYSGIDGSLLYQWFGQSENANFGRSVAGAGDVNGDGYADLIVGAEAASPGGLTEAGSVYVYSGVDGSILHQWDGGTANFHLGNSVSGAGDLNQDGLADLIVGTYTASPFGRNTAGSVSAYSGADGSLLYQWHGATAGDWFGYSVSQAGDVNGDGFDDVIVGDWSSPGGVLLAGSAHVYSGADGSQIHHWSGESALNYFGSSVAAAGDVNQDGFADLMIGARGATPDGITNAGSAYVYSGADGAQLYQWNGAATYDAFGASVSGAGDLDADGFPDLLVGAFFADPGGRLTAGSAYAYSGADGSLLHQWNGSSADDRFGSSVSGAGDTNADGYADVIVGAETNDIGMQIDAGSAHLYGFNPFLRANTPTISAASGGNLMLDLDFPQSAGLDAYKILISATGTGPIHYGVEVPLSLDRLVVRTFGGHYPGTASRMQGWLDARGGASAQLTLPAGLPAALIGSTFFLAAIANQPGQLPNYSSIALPLTITP